MNEFELIEQYFLKVKKRKDVLLGVGDDAALLVVPPNQVLVTSTDTLISGVHFPHNTSPFDIGYKSLAVNLSDLAAMGAEPAWVMLALTIPAVNKKWLQSFSRGFFELIDQYGMTLVGGDVSRGPLSITVQVMGFVPKNKALKRSGAKPGDSVYVTGTVGDAALGLDEHQQQKLKNNFLKQRLNRPEPRVEIGFLLRDIANSAIDISDGLAADLGHILEESRVGASLQIEKLPFSKIMHTSVDLKKAIMLALTGGDDYELCFTVSPEKEKKLLSRIQKSKINCTRIGTVENKKGLRLYGVDGKEYKALLKGYRHF